MSQKSSHLFYCPHLCQTLTHYQNRGAAGKRMKFATKPIWHYPLHLRHVARQRWEVKNSNFLQILKKTQTSCILLLLCYSSTNFDIFKLVLSDRLYKSSAVAEMGDRDHNRHGPKRGGGCCAPFAGGAGSASNTMWPGTRSTSVPSGVFIHPAVLPQYT